MTDYFVYIVTNAPRGTLYVGVTNDLVRRAYEHREGLVKGFTQRYCLKMLITSDMTRRLQQFSAKRTLNTGRALGNSNWRSLQIRNGAISLKTSRADGAHGLPGLQARRRRFASFARQ